MTCVCQHSEQNAESRSKRPQRPRWLQRIVEQGIYQVPYAVETRLGMVDLEEVAAVAAIVFGTLPAMQGSRFDLADALKERGNAGANSARKLVRNGIVIVEVALSLVLLIGAGLMVRSFVELTNVSPGFEPEGVITFTATPPFGAFKSPFTWTSQSVTAAVR